MTLDLHHLGSMRVTPLALSHKKEKNKPYFDCKVFYKRPENYCEILALKGFNSFIHEEHLNMLTHHNYSNDVIMIILK